MVGGLTVQRSCVVVLGMHRSGTSAVARVISLLGASLPSHVLSASRGNETGHWEPHHLVNLHDRMLAEAGSRWDDWRAFEPEMLEPERLAYYTAEIGRVIAEEYASATLFVLKDPRACRLMPIYEKVFAEQGIAAYFVLPHRNPLAVVASLATRDQMTASFAGLLWLRHVLDAEAATRGKKRAFLSYEELLVDWRAVIARVTRSLELDWPNPIENAVTEIDSFLARELQHHAFTQTELETDTGSENWVRECYAALSQLGQDVTNDAPALQQLSRIKKEFDAVAPIFGRAAFPELAARERQLSASREQAAALLADLAVAEQRITLQAAANDGFEQEISQTKSELAETRRLADAARLDAASQEKRALEFERRLLESRGDTEIGTAKARLEHDVAIERLAREISQTRSELSDAIRLADAARLEAASHEQRAVEAERHLTELRAVAEARAVKARPVQRASRRLARRARGFVRASLRLLREFQEKARHRPKSDAARRRRGTTGNTVLVAADFLPLFDQQSGALRLKTLIEIIRDQGWTIVFASKLKSSELPGVLAAEAGRRRYEKALRHAGVARFTYGEGELDAMLAEIGQDLRYAFLSFPKVARDFLPRIRRRCPEAKIIYDMVDFHALRMRREAALTGDRALAAKAVKMRTLEIAMAEAADITIAISADEKTAMLELAPTAVITVLPNVFRAPSNAWKGPAGRRDILFLGGFWHRPNIDAVTWFVEQIWPKIRANAPGCRFLIAGSNAGPEVFALGKSEGVEVRGYVAELEPLFDAVRLFVAPLRYGAGVKGKVGQSMMLGVPVVATTIAAEGMDLVDGQTVLLADTPELFADQVVSLLNDDILWTRLQEQARDLVTTRYSVRAMSEKVEELFRA